MVCQAFFFQSCVWSENVIQALICHPGSHFTSHWVVAAMASTVSVVTCAGSHTPSQFQLMSAIDPHHTTCGKRAMFLLRSVGDWLREKRSQGSHVIGQGHDHDTLSLNNNNTTVSEPMCNPFTHIFFEPETRFSTSQIL